MADNLFVHGHSCCELRSENFSLICDPWLLGSAYWRSWWNFPKVESLDSLIKIWNNQKNIYVYLTHQHWDHFHGPTLRKIYRECKHVKFLIPQTPEFRIKKDLLEVIPYAEIIELVHAKRYLLNKRINILSFQTGPITADSALAIFNDKFCILNMNDSKIMPISLKHLKNIIPTPDISLRSHSSANSRCCKRDLSGLKRLDIIDKTRLEYTTEFLDSCYTFNTKIAIPFASNMVHLHEETEKYNAFSNFSDYVEKDFLTLNKNYPNMDCKMILPGEKINLNTFKIKKDERLRKEINNKDRNLLIEEIKSTIQDKLDRQLKYEKKTKPKDKLIEIFFLKIIKNTPSIFVNYLSSNIYIETYGESISKVYRLDFKKKSIEYIKKPKISKSTVIIRVHNYVLNEVCRMNNYSSLGVSKRLEIRTLPGNFRYEIFNLLCNSIESGGPIPFNNLLSLSFIIRWIRRFREIFDLIFFLISIVGSKKNFFKF
tara:strand:- start:764 stop:2218 length:1455 start_codon:yes stop_codon:yes gene_type:complete